MDEEGLSLDRKDTEGEAGCSTEETAKGYRVGVTVQYQKQIAVRIDVQAEEEKCGSVEAYRLKARRYRRMLKAKEEEITKLKALLESIQTHPTDPLTVSSLPSDSPTFPSLPRNSAFFPADASLEKAEITAKGRLSALESRQTPSNRHVHTPSLADDTFELAIDPISTPTDTKPAGISPQQRKQVDPITNSAQISAKSRVLSDTMTANILLLSDLSKKNTAKQVLSPKTRLKEDVDSLYSFPDLSFKQKTVRRGADTEKNQSVPTTRVSISSNRLRRLPNHPKPPKFKPPSPESIVVPRPKSEISRLKYYSRSPPSHHIPELSTATKSSSRSTRQGSLRSTVPSFTDFEDPAVRQNLAYYLQTHKASELTVPDCSIMRIHSNKRHAGKAGQRPGTPISELIYTEKYRGASAWKGVVQHLRENPILLQQLINSPRNGTTATCPDSQSPVLPPHDPPRSNSAAARLSLMSRSGRKYKVFDYASEVVSPQIEPRKDSLDLYGSSQCAPHGGRKTVKDWSCSPLNEDVAAGRYHFNWEKDEGVLTKGEMVAAVKELREGEGRELEAASRRVGKTLRKLQAELLLGELRTITPPTVPGLLESLNECLRLLHMRQLTITVLHYIHQREEALLNLASDLCKRQSLISQLCKLLSRALREWRDALPGQPGFMYLGRDFLAGDNSE